MAEKYIHRYPPCPAYEIRSFEQWLEDMAAKGWFLEKDPFFCGFAGFHQAEPKSVRYRLQPAPKKAGVFARRDRQQDAIDLAAEYGWTFLGDHQDFFIFYTDDPNLPELDTDPQVQAMALDQYRKRKRNALITELFFLLLLLALRIESGIISAMLDMPVWYYPVLLLLLVLSFRIQIKELRYLKKLQQGLVLGETPAGKKRTVRFHCLSSLALLVVYVLYMVTLWGNALSLFDWQRNRWQPAAEYTDPLPFATMEDIAGGGTFTGRAWRMDHNNELAVRTALPAHIQIQFGQYGEIVLDNKTVLDGSLDVDYYEMRSEWLAKQLFHEIQHTATLSRGKYREYQENQIPDLDVDQAAAYTNYYPTLLLRQGNKVLRVRFVQLSQTAHVAQEQWMPIFAERISNEIK